MRTFAVLVSLVLLSCGSGSDEPLRIGYKPFAEQEILAHTIKFLLNEGGQESQLVDCRESFLCHRKIRDGQIDVMVDYSGTALQFVGGPRPDRADPIAQLRKLYDPIGLMWLDELGFDNRYTLLFSKTRSISDDVRSIADLSKVQGGIRVATPPDFLRRSGDGLGALFRRYGLRLASEPIIIENPTERYSAIHQGLADVAVGYSTDGGFESLGLIELDDPVEFFPPYRAAVTIREDLCQQNEELQQSLNKLSGLFPVEVMRGLNASVQVDGESPEVVALRFLSSKRLIKGPSGQSHSVLPRTVSFSEADGFDAEVIRAIRALRMLDPASPVQRSATSGNPNVEVSQGNAHFAVSGTERFFAQNGQNLNVVAAVVLGTRYLHILRRRPTQRNKALDGKIGIQKTGTGGARVGASLLKSQGKTAHLSASAEKLVDHLSRGEIDGAIVVDVLGSETITDALASTKAILTEIPLEPDRNFDEFPSYLQRVRIPSQTYSNQDQPIETLNLQVVLVSPGSSQGRESGVAGPAGALPRPSPPLSPEQLDQLLRAGDLEVPDPVIPSAWTASQERQTTDSPGLSGGILETVLNVFVILFFVWLVLILRSKTNRRKTS